MTEDAEADLPQYECSGCGALEAELARAATSAFEHVRRLIGVAHLTISVRRCLSCHGLWLTTFTERVDWSLGDDPQYWTHIPISSPEAGELNGGNAIARATALGTTRRFLVCSLPSRGPQRIEWSRTAAVVGPHD